MKTPKIILVILLSLSSYHVKSQSRIIMYYTNQTINANRSSETIEAGDNLSRTYNSPEIYVYQIWGNRGGNVGLEWGLTAERNDVNWDPRLGLNLYMRIAGRPNWPTYPYYDRMDPPNGSTTELTNNEVPYTIATGFSLVYNGYWRYDVTVPTVAIPAETYTSNVVFTIHDL